MLGAELGISGGAGSIRVPLPGGGMTTFGQNGGPVEYLYHADHQNNGRMISNYPARTLWGITCFGPQGEVYCGVASSSLFDGSFEDTTTGLSDVGSTRYSGTMGRSISPN